MSVLTSARSAARWWHALENKKVVCRLCPRECHIPEGSRGFCFVRANVGGRLELTTYGRSSGFCIDPVEKKPLNHFLPGTPILSFGTAGCNLGCKFCQNWDISKSREVDTLAHEATAEAIVEAAVGAGCKSLAFTYNDPVIWAEYAIDIARAAHARGLKTVAVTAGYISREARGEFYEHMDAANVDLKAFTDGFYGKLCQVRLDPVLDTLRFLKHETKVWFELTNLMIPGENDSTEETKAMCAWIVENLGVDVPVHFTAFHPDFKMREKPPTPPETLVRARQIAMEAGIRYAYVGNVNDVVNQSTYCHACGKLLIRRDWYDLGEYELHGNACAFCETTIPGVFDNAGPGKWGRKRQPITIGEQTRPPPSLPTLVRISSPMKTNMAAVTAGPNIAGVTSDTAKVAEALAGGGEGGGGAVRPQIEFTAGQDAQILGFTRAIVESELRGQLFSSARLAQPLAQAATYGLFVSLHRGNQLRACTGNWGVGPAGGLAALEQILGRVAREAASNDPRFPRVTLGELPYLSVEVSLMHSPELITAKGADRFGCVKVGTHGLVIMHPNGRGLLLPHVATEAGWDSGTFLEHVCLKAGLPAQTWRDEQASLMTFRARKISDHSPVKELNVGELGVDGLSLVMQYMHLVLSGRGESTEAIAIGDPVRAALVNRVHAEELGLCLRTASGVTGTAIAPNNSLLGLAKMAAQSLATSMAQRGVAEPVEIMTLLWQPMALVAADYPQRHGLLASCAVLAQAEGRWSLVAPPAGAQGAPDGRSDPISGALAAIQCTPQQWKEDRAGRIQVRAFSSLHCQNQSAGQPAAASANGARRETVRQAFRAGTFYPADAAQMNAEVEGYLRAGGWGAVATRAYRAIMLPHAGWRFCGGTMGKTLAGVKVPRTVIIVGPRHTPLGPECSVASHQMWEIPGASVPVATRLVQRLTAAIPLLACEPEAHRQEHGTEVLLPFLRQLRPDVEIVPIVLGQCSMEMLAALARELAGIRADARSRGEDEPLLVISSDMNHFAPEAENRRRDMLAIEAMKSGNPQALLETCRREEISMCGVLPAMAVMQALLRETAGIRPELVDYSNSAAASGDGVRVVGYAGMVVE